VRPVLSRAYRIRKRPVFLNIQAHGRKIHGRHFILAYTPNNRIVSRLGITASKKTGNAVQRNTIKRIARECFRHCRIDIRGNYDIVIIARIHAGSLSKKHIRTELDNLFHRICIQKDQ